MKKSKDEENTAEIYGKKHSQWGDVARRFASNKLAMMGLIFIVFLILVAVFADVIAPYSYKTQDYVNRFAPFSWAHPFGTDEYGRDILSRVIYGARTSLLVACGGVSICLFLGGLLGLLAGYVGGVVESVIMRIMDVLMAIPYMLMAVTIQSALGSGLFNTMLAISLAGMPATARVMRSTVLQMRDQEFIEAATATGSTRGRIMFRHVLPNCLAPLVVETTLKIGAKIMGISSLSFIGLGVQEPTAEWGAMIASGRAYIRDYPPLVVIPGIAIVLTLVAFNVAGDGLRDALDPKLKD